MSTVELSLPVSAPPPDNQPVSGRKGSKKEAPIKMSNVVYLGHIPHGFYEEQMKAYFSQFGTIVNLRLSRNKKTGASKHYAFIEFNDPDVAEIVADTMNNYLMFTSVLKCHVLPASSVHAEMWKGANRRFVVSKKKKNTTDPTTPSQEQIEKRSLRLKRRNALKTKRLQALGLNFLSSESQV